MTGLFDETPPGGVEKSAPSERAFTLESLIGLTLDERYRIDKLIGKGGMGAVFLGEQVRLRRRVAIKVPKPEYCHNREFIRRFEREALSMGKVVHENIVQIYDVFVSHDVHIPSFIAMEYVEGSDLESFLKEESDGLTVAMVLDILRGIARGLDAAHAHGIIHRDIKGNNVVVTIPRRSPKIMDFGIARIEMENVYATQDTSAIGTPAFMAPEQVQGKSITSAVDIYSFGMLIYRVFTRQIAFDATSKTNLLYAQIQDAPVPAHQRNAELPAEFHKALLPSLEKRADLRPVLAVDVVESVAKALAPIANRPFPTLFKRFGSDTITSETFLPSVGTVMDSAVRKRRSLLLMVCAAAVGIVLMVVILLVLLFRPEAEEVRSGSTNRAGSAGVAGGIDSGAEEGGAMVMATATPDPTPEPRREAAPVLSPSSSPAAVSTEAATVAVSPVATSVVAEEALPPPRPTPPRRSLEMAEEETIPVPGADLRWDPAAFPPLESVVEVRRIRSQLDGLINEEIERPLRREEYSGETNVLARVESEAATDLMESYRALKPSYLNFIPSLSIRGESIYWADRAELLLDVKLYYRPRNSNNPTDQRALFASESPVRARFELEGELWRLVDFDGDLGALRNLAKESSQ